MRRAALAAAEWLARGASAGIPRRGRREGASGVRATRQSFAIDGLPVLAMANTWQIACDDLLDVDGGGSARQRAIARRQVLFQSKALEARNPRRRVLFELPQRHRGVDTHLRARALGRSRWIEGMALQIRNDQYVAIRL